MAKRNVAFTKPEDPPFLKILKKQAGYDDKNHKFDELQNSAEDFVDDTEEEAPQVVVLQPGDLTAEEANLEKQNIEGSKAHEKADLSKKIIFQSKGNIEIKKRKSKVDGKAKQKKVTTLLSFNDEEEDS